MVREIDRLAAEWVHWTLAAGMAGASWVRLGNSAAETRFCSDGGDYALRRDGKWWVVDESDERGKWYSATATFSTIQLAEKYLIWTWGSLARTTVRAEQLSRRLQQQGFDERVHQKPAARANFVELSTPDGTAIVPNSQSVILSHILVLSLPQLGGMLRTGLTGGEA